MESIMSMIDLEEPLTKEQLKQIEAYGLGKFKEFNEHVSIWYDKDAIAISNAKGGKAEVVLKLKTFAKIAKELGYSLKRSSKSG